MDGLPTAPTQPKPPPIGRVLQDSSFYLLGNLTSRAVGFFAIPFYASFLTPAQYGLIELVELSTQTIAISLGLQAIGAALSRLFYDQRTHEQEQAVVSTSLIATAILSAVVTILAVAGAGQLSQLVFHSDEWTGLLRAAFVAMFFSNMTEVVLVYERIRNNARFFLYYTLITLTLNLALNILFIGVLGAGVWGFVSSKLVVSILGSAYLAWRMRRDVGWHWRSLFVPELVRFGAPLVLSSLSYFAIHFSDRFFLSASVSLAELGRYALAYKFAILVSALVGDSFGKSWNATLYRYTDQAGWQPQFARIASYFTLVLFATGLGIALFSPELLRIMVPNDYYPPPLLLPIIIASYLAREIGDFFRSLLLINKRAGRVGQIAGGGAMLNLVANVLLIPRFGIYGAAYATLITWAAYMVACWIIANREHRLPIRIGAYVRISVLVTIIYLLASAARVHAMLPQLVINTLWLALFVILALRTFFSPEERRGALGFLGVLCLWAFARSTSQRRPGTPARADDGPWQVLMLSYDFPTRPDAIPGRSNRLATGLARTGIDVTIVTATPTPDAESRPATIFNIPGTRPTPRDRTDPAPEPAPIPRPTRYGAAILQLSERLLLPYDDRFGWFPYAYAASVTALAPNTVLFSTHPPLVTHLTALALKHRHGHPWIADFRDPLSGNPARPSPRAAVVDPLIERLTLDHADAIIANTEAAAETLRRRYPALHHKIHTIWNGYDPEDIVTPLPIPHRDTRILAHVGALTGNRSLLPLIQAIQRLIARGALNPNELAIHQLGHVDPASHDRTQPRLAALETQGLLTIRDQPSDPRTEMLTADWLLLLDMIEDNPGLQIPAKSYEYIRTGRPILALTARQSATQHLLARAGIPHACLHPDAPPGEFDATLLAFLQADHTPTHPSADFLASFAAPAQIDRLIHIIEHARTHPQTNDAQTPTVNTT